MDDFAPGTAKDRTYFILWYRLDQRNRYLLWFSDEKDGVVIDTAGYIPVFRTQDDLRAYAVAHSLPINQELLIMHDLDAVTGWLRRKRPTRPDCNHFLEAWNLLADVSETVGGSFDPDRKRTGHIYRKLFWGCNLPALTPPGKHYEPYWSGKECREMRDVLRGGLSLFRSHVRLQKEVGARP